MLRSRRYRSFVVFSVIFGLALLQFLRTREWTGNVPDLRVPPATNPNHEFPSAPEPATGIKFDSKPIADKPPIPEEHHPSNAYPPPSPNQETPPKQKELPEDEEWEADIPYKAPTHATTNYENEIDSSYVEAPSHKIPEDKPLSQVTEQTSPKEQPSKVAIPSPLPSATSKQHWQKLPEHFPVAEKDLIKLPTDRPKSLPKLQPPMKDESTTQRNLRLQRLAAIKEEFEHAWDGYTDYALGHDEIRPVSGKYRDPFAGWGATLVDALDTLWIMGMKDEFAAAVEEVKKIDFTTSVRDDIPLFETVIRYLGGLLGAYDVSSQKYPSLLEKAEELAEILIGAFDTPNRMPLTHYYWAP